MTLRRQFYFFGFISVVFLMASLPFKVEGQPESAQQLRDDLAIAVKSGDTNAIIALFDLDGETNEVEGSADQRRMLVRLQTYALLHAGKVDIRLVPLPNDFTTEQQNEVEGTRLKFNIGVTGLIEMMDLKGNVQHLPYGKNRGHFFIAGMIRERVPGQHLSVRVLAGPDSDSMTFTGSLVYVKGGTNVTVDIGNNQHRYENFWGDYIKSCTIHRTSLNPEAANFASWFQFEVIQGNRRVFESPEMTNEEAVTYVGSK